MSQFEQESVKGVEEDELEELTDETVQDVEADGQAKVADNAEELATSETSSEADTQTE